MRTQLLLPRLKLLELARSRAHEQRIQRYTAILSPLLWLPGELIEAMQLPQHFSFQKYETVYFSNIICHIISDIKHID